MMPLWALTIIDDSVESHKELLIACDQERVVAVQQALVNAGCMVKREKRG